MRKGPPGYESRERTEAASLDVVMISRRLLRISSSLALVASLRLMRSVALSRLRLLSAAISFCRDVAMLVRLRICLDRFSTATVGCLVMATSMLVLPVLARMLLLLAAPPAELLAAGLRLDAGGGTGPYSGWTVGVGKLWTGG